MEVLNITAMLQVLEEMRKLSIENKAHDELTFIRGQITALKLVKLHLGNNKLSN